ncbi:Hypothetical predicted protein [Podarcis lilfordi]|uniref:Uncharacterized protein n=1 Tax=Podarcis lilfordi TaxID=74358 RepID=A0AA35KFY0_9SAUR|nr:Hypothetical predicted protein [Podarcis lilfordi]
MEGICVCLSVLLSYLVSQTVIPTPPQCQKGTPCPPAMLQPTSFKTLDVLSKRHCFVCYNQDFASELSVCGVYAYWSLGKWHSFESLWIFKSTPGPEGSQCACELDN